MKRFAAVLFLLLALCGSALGQWKGGEGLNRLGTGLRDFPGADAGVWYPTGLIDWVFVENMAKDRAKARGHANRWKEYLVRFMPEPHPLAPPVAPPPPYVPPVAPPPPAVIPDPVQPPPAEYKLTYWAPMTGIYKPGNPTNGSDYLSDNGRLNNPYREIRFAKILYRGTASMEGYTNAVRDVMAQCKEKDQTFELGADGKFTVVPSKDIGPSRKAIFAWSDDVTGDYAFVVVDRVENGVIHYVLNKGQTGRAVADPGNFINWSLGSYIGEISVPRGSGARLAVVPTGRRNKFASVQLWLHHGDVAASFRLRDLQN